MLAAGAEPSKGDINLDQRLDAFMVVARAVEPALLKEHMPLFGPFAKPDVLSAWLNRFLRPQAWLDCDVASSD